MTDRLQQAVAARAIEHDPSTVVTYVTISLGSATLVPDPASPQKTLIERADCALHRAKAEARNRINGRARFAWQTRRRRNGTNVLPGDNLGDSAWLS